MSKRFADINAKITYITNRKTGPILKTRRPLIINEDTKFVTTRQEKNKISCSDEVAALFLCLKENNYLDANCKPELRKYMECDGKVKANIQKQESYVKLSRGHLKFNEARDLLKSYPNPVHKKSHMIKKNNLISYAPVKRVKLPNNDLARPFKKV